jgi:hypothetical protein
MTQHIRCSITTLLVSLMPSLMWAQGAQPADADAKELASYRLTMDTLRKVEVASRAMVAAAKQDPRFQKLQKIQAELEALEKKEELTDADVERMEALEAQKEELEASTDLDLGSADSLDEMEANIAKSPMVAKALQQAGLTPREYSKFMMAMVQAAFAAGFKKAGMLKELPAGVNPDNVKFVEEHEAELKAMQAEFEKMSKGGADQP